MKEGVWLLLGPERGQKQDFINELKQKLTKDHKEVPEIHKFYAFETPFSEILSLLQNGDLFCAHKMIVVNNVEDYKKADTDLIKDYYKAPSPESTLVMVSEETKLDTLTKGLPKDQAKVFWEMFESQKKGWVIHHFKDLGMTLVPDAAEFFLEMVENSTDQIRLEAQKLLAFFEKGSTITLEELENYLVHTKEENVFSLFERISEGQLPRALEVLKKILSSKESEAIGLLGGLVWQFKNLMQFQIKLLERNPPDEAFVALNIRSKKAQANYLQGAKHYTLGELQKILVLTAEFDQRLRQFKTDQHALLMDLYLYYIMVKKGQLPESPEFY